MPPLLTGIENDTHLTRGEAPPKRNASHNRRYRKRYPTQRGGAALQQRLPRKHGYRKRYPAIGSVGNLMRLRRIVSLNSLNSLISLKSQWLKAYYFTPNFSIAAEYLREFALCSFKVRAKLWRPSNSGRAQK